MRWGLFSLAVAFAQVGSFYRRLHPLLYPMVQDTTHRGWLGELRRQMEKNRGVEWNDRFFRQVASLYLETPDEADSVVHAVAHEVGVSGDTLLALWAMLRDKDVLPDYLMAAWRPYRTLEPTHTATAWLVRDLVDLGEAVVETWLPTGAPIGGLVEAAWLGYLRAVLAGYRFFGFAESGEPWQQKLALIGRIGLLEYYAYGETANRYRAWKRGHWP